MYVKGSLSVIEARTPTTAVQWVRLIAALRGLGLVFPEDDPAQQNEENEMWTAQLTYHAPRLDLERRLEVVEALQANASYNDATGRLVLTFEVEATTARQAADSAARTGGAAVSAAARGLVPVRPTRILVMPTEDFIAETEYPSPIGLSGVAEIAEILGVSRQRAFQLLTRKDFPGSVAHLASGPVFTTSSIHEFQRRWEPTRRGGRPARPPTTGAPVDHAGHRCAGPGLQAGRRRGNTAFEQ